MKAGRLRVGQTLTLALVLAGGGAHAQSTQAQSTKVHEAGDANAASSTKMSGHAANALAAGRTAEAAVLAEQATSGDGLNPWGHYRRAAALSDLHRTDEAIEEFKLAEQAFSAVDARGQSLALYGRANTLAQAGRCKDARPVFEEYAKLVEPKDPTSAAQARTYARDCHTQ
jgi:hypothetical protein